MTTDNTGAGEDGDGLDAWMAKHFPPPTPPVESEPEPPAAPTPPVEPTFPPVAPAFPPVAPAFPPVEPQPPVAPSHSPAGPQPPLVPPLSPVAPTFPPVDSPFPPVAPTPLGAPPAGPFGQAPFDQPPFAQPPFTPPPGGPFSSAPFPPTPAVSSEPPIGTPLIPPMAEELDGLPHPTESIPSPTEVLFETHGASGIDSLFGESSFRDYEEQPGPSQNPFAKSTYPPGGTGEINAEPPAGASRSQKTLLWISGALVAVLALTALYLMGTKLPMLLGPAPVVIAVPTVTPTPTPTELPLGPVAPGEYRWEELLGGECLNPYPGPWENEYTVVDCEIPHAAQLVARGTFGPDDGFTTPYPGTEALQSQVNLLCTAPTVVDYSKANEYTDIQYEASYPVNADDWVAGDRDYYCFLSRSTAGALTGSIAMPQVEPSAEPEPAP